MTMQEAVDYYADLAQQPGWRHYVSHRVKEMEAEAPELYQGLYATVKRRLAEIEGKKDERLD